MYFYLPFFLSLSSFRIWQDFSCPFFTCCTLHCFRPWGLGCFSRQKTCHVTLKRPPHFDEFFSFQTVCRQGLLSCDFTNEGVLCSPRLRILCTTGIGHKTFNAEPARSSTPYDVSREKWPTLMMQKSSFEFVYLILGSGSFAILHIIKSLILTGLV